MSSLSINRATFRVTEADLEYMVLPRGDFPAEFAGYQVVREGVLDNENMAAHGFPGSSAERFRQAGRITGYMRECGPNSRMAVSEGLNFVGATVAHLFDTPEAVSDWMHDIFLKDFEDNVGNSVGEGRQIISVQRLELQGFFDEAVGLRVLQGGPAGLTSSSVIDFRVGRILGVAFVGTVGDHERLDLTSVIGRVFEKRIVGVVLGAI